MKEERLPEKMAVICFTEQGCILSQTLKQKANQLQFNAPKQYAQKFGLIPLDIPLQKWVGKMFQEMECILFIGACGISVRSIAPFLKDKTADPAVLVADDAGKHVISLLSGHLGGANKFAVTLAEMLHSIPVITTSSDINGKTAVDVFAQKYDLAISSMETAKQIAAAVLREEKIFFFSDFPISGKLPNEWTETLFCEECSYPYSISISVRKREHFGNTMLYLIPPVLFVGIGCKKGVSAELIEEQVSSVLDKHGYSRKAVAGVASIDLKKEEQGIKAFCEKWSLPFQIYSAEQLEEVEGRFTDSDFVKHTTGVGNVCERAAVKMSGGALLIRKTKGMHITVAVAVKEWRLCIE